MKKIFILIIILIVSNFSCKTDFDINAKWKDITVVYGLLSQNDTVHYVKINKAFLGNANALKMAQIADSASYGNNLQVWVEEWLNNSQTNSWNLDTTTIYNKESGTFYAPKQVIYKFKAPLNVDAEYRLYVKNKLTGNITSSVTPLVDNIDITSPAATQLANFHSSSNVSVKWFSSLNGKLYQVIIRFNYWEKNLDTGDSIKRSIDWSLGTVSSLTTQGSEPMSTTYYGNSFFQYIANQINNSSNVPVNVTRHAATPNVDFIFLVAADDFNTYMEVNAPSTGVLQEKPQYTNVSNGIGIFSSRLSADRPLNMAVQSKDSLIKGMYTKNLNFK
jgi:hypothetical protein